ncbi:MAG: NFACT family protein [Clostridia bacterium]|nr:NFACT family protein [Clostridia bacterium]
MAFDAGYLYAVVRAIRRTALGARIERVTQPQKDEIVLQMRTTEGGKRLLINAGASDPRIGFTDLPLENPAQPPMLCMLLRKHLTGSTLSDIRQFGFERACALVFDTRDEMGFPTKKHLIAEIMGKYSNLIFTDAEMKILSALRIVDFTTSSLRQVLPGMPYELPPPQTKADPLEETADGLLTKLRTAPADQTVAKWLGQTYLGLSPAVCREMAFRASGRIDSIVSETDTGRLADTFFGWFRDLKDGSSEPCVAFERRKPVEYAYAALTHLETASGISLVRTADVFSALDRFYSTRETEARIRAGATDILHVLSRNETRLVRKLQLQEAELAACEEGGSFKRTGDLITQNLYQLKPGMTEADLTDYEAYDEASGTYGTVHITLDRRLSPAQNAQKYYKKYAKTQNAKTALTEQIRAGNAELLYLQSVSDALSRAQTLADLSEIREELTASGYLARSKKPMPRKGPLQSPPLRYRSPSGLTVLCGKNNLQNDRLTFHTAAKTDYWFHVKGAPGSHVILCTEGKEPEDADFTAAAEIAAYNSKLSDGQSVPVDYTLVRNLRKPPASAPGFVIFHTNWTAYVTPDPDRVENMRQRDE